VIIRWCPAIRGIVGTDAHTGWLPPGAAQPLPEPPTESVLDVRIENLDDRFSLEWQSHNPSQWSLASGRGSRAYDTLEKALTAASELFGVGNADWMPGTLPDAASPEYVSAAITRELVLANMRPGDLGARLVEPPRKIDVLLSNGATEPLWLVCEADYSIVFDPATAQYGLVEDSDGDRRVLIGLYGSLLATLAAQ
jgi:hypothetical protein